MQLSVRLFGGLVQAAGAAQIDVAVDEDATVADLRRAVADAYPALAPLLRSVNVAVDLEVAGPMVNLDAGQEIALLPPVAGGSSDDSLDSDDASSVAGGSADDSLDSDDASSVAGSSHEDRGADVSGKALIRTGLVSPPFDVDEVIAQVSGPSVGAAATFLGTVRDHAPDLDGVTALEYSAYEPMAEKVLADIAAQIGADYNLTGVALLHAVGTLPVGAHTVLIVCTSAHRATAFDACRDALEQVKDHVPVFKREITADGAHRWVGLPDGPGAPDGTDAPDAPDAVDAPEARFTTPNA